MADYIQVSQTLLVREDIRAQVPTVDTIIFDIDGVLIDVRGSFREGIRETVQYYLKKNYDLDSLQLLVSPEDIRRCKLAGGFNNDTDIAEGLLAFYILKIRNNKVANLLELKTIEPAWEPFIKTVQDAGGGLATLYRLLGEGLPAGEQEGLKSAIHREEIEQLFQELYGGINYCERLYKRQPTFFRGIGKVENEKNILNQGLVRPERFNYGILTGRTKGEMEVALEQLGMAEILHPEALVYDDGTTPTKPHPAGLHKITDYLLSQRVLYCGDVMDDWKLVTNFRKESDRPIYFCYCAGNAGDPEETAYFKNEGVEIIADQVNDALIWLYSQKKER